MRLADIPQQTPASNLDENSHEKTETQRSLRRNVTPRPLDELSFATNRNGHRKPLGNFVKLSTIRRSAVSCPNPRLSPHGEFGARRIWITAATLQLLPVTTTRQTVMAASG